MRRHMHDERSSNRFRHGEFPADGADHGRGEGHGRGAGRGRGFGPGGFGPGGFGPGGPGGPGFGPEGFGPGGHGGPGRGRGRGRGRRGVQRGDVRIAVLKLLESEPMHGYQIVSSIEERTAGAWKPSPGAIYPTLSQLEDEGLISIERENGRKVATLTDAGREYVTESLADNDPFAGFAGGSEERGHLRDTLHELHEVTRRVGRTGGGEQIAAVDAILGDAIKQIYLLLAGVDRTPPTTGGESATDVPEQA
ncbi:Transcriptional regulator, PadR-like family OS=Tsukamurella paurometabola (strain ATCC 8368 / DSM / CCUG 35730 / CIP 100753 / JCM 10117 / KCTC 9821 / NBRC 16120 / NCIMB 702349 / NCTC 13040) OX=521096 GN=Tpau_2305 PE=4 SV=1 [Tsukamurella paurometabola]|uniref:Transcriptional regulator, PadR-like family n=1 Tax=Tsukamurella paurometabola (strain ATCC 8368 / DSM 20162 / CCUG 35730 / CIP 100753 / JCM 10117 / KCTC 9821 / NBRC 16120 / NCIMB 702349 / NCTC 13040) TaxID=521096 RepID=D5UQE2_TSUPD|nr:PadR family transcriptional regulator [Tsukamurella paurometabola]ADG78912.1 transcriptional regulator, PadR-like family [Tsukamurella paurometabola DSM 20162]SUP33490.1 Transcriptional regulator YqjI [Tsukamurella paurometabola]